MKTKNILLSLTLITCLIPGQQVRAHGGDGFKQVFKSFFGSEGAKKRSSRCDMADTDSNSGLLQTVNSFFCHMEKDMGIKGVTTGVTKVFGSKSVRASVTAGPFTVNSVSYAYQAQVWVCNSACTSTSAFSRAINIYFSYSPDKTINKGDMIFDTGAFDSTFGQNGLHLTYDVGSSTATQTMSARAVFQQNGTQQELRVDSSKTGNVLGVTIVVVSGATATTANSFRFAAQLDTSLNTGGVYFEVPTTSSASGAGVAAVNISSASDSKTASSMCLARVADGVDDWNYTTTGSTGCAVQSFSSDSATAVGAYTVTAILTGGSLWNGMAANPPAI